MVSKEEFDEYKKTLFSEEDKSSYNQSVKKIRIVRYILWAIEAFVAILVLAINLSSSNGMKPGEMVTVMVVPMLCLMAFIVTTVITKILEKNKLEKLREAKVPKLLEFLIGDQLNSFSIDGYLPEGDFKNSGFAGSFDDYKGEDLIDVDIPKDNGKRSGVPFRACDLRVTREETDSDGNKHDVTVYSGTFCAVHFPFEFKCRLAINSSISGVKKFKLEDVSFNKSFQVFTNDKVEALCILTPTMMQKLVKLKEMTRSVKISLFGNHLYFGFPGFNLFEFGKTKNGLNDDVFNEIYDDVALLLAIVNEIKSNNKVFKI